MNKDTFCIMAHRGFYVQPNKDVKPCCVFGDFDEPVLYDETKTFDELYTTPQFKDLRNKLDNGKVHSGCEGCFNGRTSFREDMNKLFLVTDLNVLQSFLENNNQSEFEIHYLDLRHSNLCNFKCTMCGDTYSSQWSIENQKLGEKVNTSPTVPSNTWLSPVKDQIKNMKIVYFGGGEPLILKETYELIKELQYRQDEVRLLFNTNLSTLSYKQDNIVDLVKDFKEVDFMVSCDGLGEIGEYQRTGFETSKFLNNVTELYQTIKTRTNISLAVTFAISPLNVFKLQETYEYFNSNFNVPKQLFRIETIDNPWDQSLKYASTEFKMEAVEYLETLIDNTDSEFTKRIKRLVEFIKVPTTPPPGLTLEGVNRREAYISKRDAFRKVDINTLDPRYMEYMIGNMKKLIAKTY